MCLYSNSEIAVYVKNQFKITLGLVEVRSKLTMIVLNVGPIQILKYADLKGVENV